MSPRRRRSNRSRQWDPRWRGVTLDPDFEIREVADATRATRDSYPH